MGSGEESCGEVALRKPRRLLTVLPLWAATEKEPRESELCLASIDRHICTTESSAAHGATNLDVCTRLTSRRNGSYVQFGWIGMATADETATSMRYQHALDSSRSSAAKCSASRRSFSDSIAGCRISANNDATAIEPGAREDHYPALGRAPAATLSIWRPNVLPISSYIWYL